MTELAQILKRADTAIKIIGAQSQKMGASCARMIKRIIGQIK